jgi:hypothetical protein
MTETKKPMAQLSVETWQGFKPGVGSRRLGSRYLFFERFPVHGRGVVESQFRWRYL